MIITEGLTDEDLMLKFQEGSEDAYVILVERYKDKLLNHIFFFVRDKGLAEDIVQDALVRVYLNKEKYKTIAKVSTWIYTIATNLAKTQLSKKSRKSQVSISSMLRDQEKDFEIEDKKKVTDESLYTKELNEKIFNAINNLDPIYKEIVIMRDVDELSYDEIGKVLNVPIGTVKSRLNRARSILRDDIYEYVNS